MTTEADQSVQEHADELYNEYWHVNTGGQTIHAKRMPGRFRNIKWMTASVWLIFFIGPYIRWKDRQAILFDIPGRKFHIFDITIMPQDVWMLSLTLLFFAILLAVVTSIAGRVFCGYFCFQTVWTDIFTFIEEKLEGPPQKRRKLDEAPWSGHKLLIKGSKNLIWIAIGSFTGIHFTLWFVDAFQMWHGYLTLTAPTFAWGAVVVFTFFTYLFGGIMREQVCFWLCPYARIQGVMYDKETILPTYDFHRGEPRGKLKKGQVAEGLGDCIDCGQCVAVCPTGIDIRQGQQEGCITCALCIDACDSVMDKIQKPRGLIRYASWDEIDGIPTKPFWRRARPLVYITIMVLAAGGILYGLTHLGALDLRVLHERQPLYVQQSDGSIQNKYELKILNKLDHDVPVEISVSDAPSGYIMDGANGVITARGGEVTVRTVFMRVKPEALTESRLPVTFVVRSQDGKLDAHYDSMFFSPDR